MLIGAAALAGFLIAAKRHGKEPNQSPTPRITATEQEREQAVKLDKRCAALLQGQNKAEARAGFEDVCDTCEKEGLFPAMQKFMVLVGVQGGPPQPDHEPTPEEKAQQALMMGNMSYFFGRYIRNIGRYEPDLDAIAQAPCRVIGAIGAESNDSQLACAGGKRVAQIAGGEPVVFPGDHGGFDGKPKEFAAKLIEVLAK